MAGRAGVGVLHRGRLDVVFLLLPLFNRDRLRVGD